MLSEGNDRMDRPFVDEITASQEASDCMLTMGETSENVSKQFNVTREQQDTYAVESYRRAEAAQKAGWFDDELVSITVKKDGNGEASTLREHLGEADIDCGATTRIPIDVPKGRAGIDIAASTTDRSERALFDSFIVKRGDKA